MVVVRRAYVSGVNLGPGGREVVVVLVGIVLFLLVQRDHASSLLVTPRLWQLSTEIKEGELSSATETESTLLLWLSLNGSPPLQPNSSEGMVPDQ